MVATVNWDPNRYGSTKRVLSYNASTGSYSVVDQDHNYTGITYNFAALPAAGTTTGTTTGTTSTTQTQTASAFGDVRPLYGQGDGGQDGANVFQWGAEKEPVTELTGMFAPISGYAGPKPSGVDRLRHKLYDVGQSFGLSKTEREWADVDRTLDEEYYKEKGLLPPWEKEDRPGLTKRLTGFVTKPIKKAKKAWQKTFKPLALRAIDFATRRSGANQSFRNIAGLYTSEITLMQKYGSTGATDMNPTGDPRKDDGGFNIVSGAGNYNKLGTGSRRHNMLKEADVYEKMSKEWREKRNQIRADWKKEKETGVENTTYNINSSGSTPDTGDRNGGTGTAGVGDQAAADVAGGVADVTPF